MKEKNKNLWQRLRTQIRDIANINDHIDTEDAAERIKSGIWFRGPNVWILAFAIVIASVGLNVNSTAVIIGAMLISPLMGPIIGIGLSLGTNDTGLLREGARNLLIMVAISLLASCLYFLISPLELVNPTELEARTSPTLYDVMIAFFGGLAGIFENCRKERGTVISGVAIATALMPPICTAGYGLAHANAHFFFGALYLFLINAVFIIIATYLTVKYLRFPSVDSMNTPIERRHRAVVSAILIAFLVPSVWSAFTLVRNNNFDRKVQVFVSENRIIGNSYIYDYHVGGSRERRVELMMAGSQLSEEEMNWLMDSAERIGLKENQISIKERAFGGRVDEGTEKLLKSVYEPEITRKDLKIQELESRLQDIQTAEIPYVQIAREVRVRYPEITDLTLSKGAAVDDSLQVSARINVIAVTADEMDPAQTEELAAWLKVRLNDTTVVVMNIRK